MSHISPRRPTTRLLLLSLATAVPLPLAAQEQAGQAADSTASLVGEVRAEMSGRPVPRAQVFLRQAQKGAVTDSSGTFRIDALPPGSDTLVIRYTGIEPKSTVIDLRPDRTTRATFIVSEQVFEVADLEVQVRQLDPRERRVEERMTRGHGAYVTRDEIAERDPELLSDMLRGIPRVDVRPYRGQGFQKVLIGRGTTACEPTYYLDGTRQRERFLLDELDPQLVDLIEIYRSPAEVPTQFRLDTNRCGVILLWIRSGGPSGAAGGGD